MWGWNSWPWDQELHAPLTKKARYSSREGFLFVFKDLIWNTWVAQLVAYGSDYDSGVPGLSLALGSLLSVEPASFSACLFLHLPLPLPAAPSLMLSCCFWQINKGFYLFILEGKRESESKWAGLERQRDKQTLLWVPRERAWSQGPDLITLSQNQE